MKDYEIDADSSDASDGMPRPGQVVVAYVRWALALSVLWGVSTSLSLADAFRRIDTLEFVPRLLLLAAVRGSGTTMSLLSAAFSLVSWSHGVAEGVVVQHRTRATVLALSIATVGTFVVLVVSASSGALALHLAHHVSWAVIADARSALAPPDTLNAIVRFSVAAPLVGVSAWLALPRMANVGTSKLPKFAAAWLAVSAIAGIAGFLRAIVREL